MQEIRKYLHQNPELSGIERETATFISEKLMQLGVKKIHQNFSEYSVLAEIDFKKPGKTVLFRCELDALPIEEVNTFEYKSVKKGVSHKCGHDGHMVILLGLAEKLVKAELSGKVLLLFQSAEENGNGAKSILKSGKLYEFKIDFVFALHNIPGFPLGNVICKPRDFTPCVESIDVHLHGKTSHAGMPENGVNPAGSIAKIIQYFERIHHPDEKSKHYFLATPIQIKMGKPAYGISAGEAVVSYTFRTWDKAFLVQQTNEIVRGLKEILEKTKGMEYSFKWKQAFDANINAMEAYEIIENVSKENKLKFIKKETPFSFGEDFGSFTQEYKGAMFGLGAGENSPELHNPDYDFPDELHEKGVRMFFEIAKMILKK